MYYVKTEKRATSPVEPGDSLMGLERRFLGADLELDMRFPNADLSKYNSWSRTSPLGFGSNPVELLLT